VTKPYKYRVTCTEAIAAEMARYEGSSFRKVAFPPYVALGERLEEQEAIAWTVKHFGPNGPRDHLRYEWEFVGESLPARDRWSSFGVSVRRL